MSKLYTPVTSSTFVRVETSSVFTVRVSTHNRPTVRMFWGAIGRANFGKVIEFASRGEAREFAETKINDLVDGGYAQVA